MKKKKELHQFELSNLKNSSAPVILDKKLSEGGFAPLKSVTEHIDTKSAWKPTGANDWLEKLANARALKQAGKKVAGVIPLAGTAYAALSGDPAMASEELVGDVPVVGQAYEALKSEDAGNREEERLMLADRNAQRSYAKSGAAQDARRTALTKFGGHY